MTAIDAYQRDYRVVIASDAVASYDEEHHQVTLRYLGREMAQLMTNAELFEAATAFHVERRNR
jgi:isochorismate hydrolase